MLPTFLYSFLRFLHLTNFSEELTDVVSIFLSVLPEIPADAPEVSDVTRDSLKLTWKPGTPSDVKYLIEERFKGEEDWQVAARDISENSHQLKSVDLSHPKEYRIKATSPFGMSKPTKSATVEKKIGPPIMPKGVLELTILKPESVQLKWPPATIEEGCLESPISYIVEMRYVGHVLVHQLA